MRTIEVSKGKLVLKDEVDVFYERTITPFGNSAKVDAPRKYVGRRVYVIVMKDEGKIDENSGEGV